MEGFWEWLGYSLFDVEACQMEIAQLKTEESQLKSSMEYLREHQHEYDLGTRQYINTRIHRAEGILEWYRERIAKLEEILKKQE